jgi:segregation and condensation protein B
MIFNYSMTDQTDPKLLPDLEDCLEALLFVAGGPVTLEQLAGVLERQPEEVKKGLENLEQMYNEKRGLALQWHNGKVQLTTNPVLADYVETFLGLDATTRLSRAALETLAIVAYRQPITRPGIDSVRGVNSDGALKSLLTKGLIEEVGRADTPGRPILYGVTNDFLQYFGLSSLRELPPFEALIQDENAGENNKLLKD